MKAINSFFKSLGICLFLMLLIAQISVSEARLELLGDRAVVVAVNTDAAAQKAEKASEKVRQEDSIKTKFGETEEGQQMIDKARETAQEKLKTLAEKSKNKRDLESLPPNEQNFLENLHGDSNE
ncbi:MAG: hypothetical protein MUD14_09210 [Hydrococcus sp. Prado102]|jgi:hypothetical protein|nr:hypothetical protein [Hydrococcus sp. Prado102]